jgi:hypothetical protein
VQSAKPDARTGEQSTFSPPHIQLSCAILHSVCAAGEVVVERPPCLVSEAKHKKISFSG